MRQKVSRTTFDLAGSATSGAIQAAGRYSQVYDTAGQPIGGELQRQVEQWSAQMNRARQMMSITRGKDRMFWIRQRKEFNRLIIDRCRAGQYRSVPTVSVSALTKTIRSVYAKGGSLVDDFTRLAVGDEVWFVRSDYSSFGVVGMRDGRLVFKSPTGVVLDYVGETDIVFLTKRKFVSARSISKARKWAEENVARDAVGYDNFDLKVANEFNRVLSEKLRLFKLGKLEVAGARFGGDTAIMYSTEEGIFVNLGPAANYSNFGDSWYDARNFFNAYGKHQLGATRYKSKQMIEYCVTHEIGHQILQKISSTLYNEWSRYFYSLETPYIDNLLSIYATTSMDEFFAEAFTVYHMGGVKLPSKMTKLIEEISKGG